MTITNARRGLQRRIYMPTVAEGTYGEGDTTFTHAFNALRNDGEAIRTSVLTTTDEDFATGREFAQNQIHLGVDLPPRTFTLPLTTEALGLFGAFALGDDTKTTASGTTLHTLAMVSLAAGYPGSFGMEEHLGGATADSSQDENLRGVVVDSITISGDREGLTRIAVTVSGNGGRGTAQTQTESGLIIPATYYPAAAIHWGIRATAAEHDPEDVSYTKPSTSFTPATVTSGNGWTLLSPMLSTWSITYTNVWGVRRAPGTSTSAGLLGVCPTLARRTISAEITFLQSAGYDTLTQALIGGTNANNVEYSLACEAVSDEDLATNLFAGWLIHLPVCGLADNPSGSFSDLNSDTATFIVKQSAGADAYNAMRIITHDARDVTYNA